MIAQMDRQLRRIGPGDEIGRAHQIGELVARDPLPSRNQFVFHGRHVRGRPAEGGDSEAREYPGHFGERR